MRLTSFGPTPGISRSRSGVLSMIFGRSSPKRRTSRRAPASATPLIRPEPKKATSPSSDAGGSSWTILARNCRPQTLSWYQSPSARSSSPTSADGMTPTTTAGPSFGSVSRRTV